jgi:hypothetical protein
MTEETMKSRTLICITAMTLFAAPAIPLRLAAQDGQNQQPKHHHYKLIDVGTLGGPNSYLPLLPPYHSFVPSESLSRGGIFAGFAETATPDPYAPFCFNADCFASRGEMAHLLISVHSRAQPAPVPPLRGSARTG